MTNEKAFIDDVAKQFQKLNDENSQSFMAGIFFGGILTMTVVVVFAIFGI
ncbi:MAG: hypothetical protein HY376_03940 [Candidatus Blackburnbacteria bacterium]|nr:hypothetical protein [Candidatus Blackburnbacteria bacterium]